MQNQLVPLDHSRIDRDGAGIPAVFGAVASGDPVEVCIDIFDNPTRRFACGVWQCSVGVVEMKDWPYDELCVLLAGRVIITPRGGQPQEYAQGEAFVIPRGFTGTWDIRETIRKYYAIQRHNGYLDRIKGKLGRLKGKLSL
jgi:uncharacterized cupin superfamily protein